MAIATTVNAPNATQLRLSAITNWPTGRRWKKLKAAALTIALPNPIHNPQNADTMTTTGRYATLSDTTGATWARG